MHSGFVYRLRLQYKFYNIINTFTLYFKDY